MKGAETKMTVLKKTATAFAVIACAGLALSAAGRESVRLVGVSAESAGKTAAVLIESTEPAAYAVSRPDPLTVLVDLRDVALGEVTSAVSPKGPVAGVKIEQATSNGSPVARVRIALTSPSTYKVKSSRNVIRLDLEPEKAMPKPRVEDLTTALAAPAAPAARGADTVAVLATQLEKVRANHTRTSTTVTLSGNGRLNPSSLTESDDQPRRLVLDFPNVASAASPKTGIDSVFVKQVRV